MRILKFLAQVLLHAFAPVIPIVAGSLMMWSGNAMGVNELVFVGLALVALGLLWFVLRMVASLDL